MKNPDYSQNFGAVLPLRRLYRPWAVMQEKACYIKMHRYYCANIALKVMCRQKYFLYLAYATELSLLEFRIHSKIF